LSPDSASAHILCAGIVVLDEVFRVADVPPTDTKADATDFVSVSGGCAANAAVAIARLGGKVAFAGPFGVDDTADRIQTILEREGIDCGGCVRITGATSSVSAILVNAAGQRTIVTHSDPALLSAISSGAAGLVANASCVLVDNRRPKFVAGICAAAQARGIPIVIDVDKSTGFDDPLLQMATHAIFSAESLRFSAADRDLTAALRKAYGKLQRFVGVTDGAQDALWSNDGAVQRTRAFEITAVDTLAAGDTFHGAFALALIEGRDLPSAMRFAAAAAALKCMHFGGSATAPTRAELDAFLRQHG
jgi:sugar/nucleoside kinase (ribokinase family)